MRAHFLALSNGWLIVVALVLAVIYVWIKVIYFRFLLHGELDITSMTALEVKLDSIPALLWSA